MNTMTINGRVYPAKELDFNFLCELGDHGIGMDEMEVKIFPVLRAYVAWCIGTDVKTAGDEINLHIMNGGSLDTISDAFAKAGEESGFFRNLNKQQTVQTETTTTSKKHTKKTEEASE